MPPPLTSFLASKINDTEILETNAVCTRRSWEGFCIRRLHEALCGSGCELPWAGHSHSQPAPKPTYQVSNPRPPKTATPLSSIPIPSLAVCKAGVAATGAGDTNTEW